jgi:hypothetical protein
MQCRGENASIHFLRAFAHLQILSTTRPNCGWKSPVRRDFSIGRCRLTDSGESIGAVFNPTVLALRFHSILAQEPPPENLSAGLSAADQIRLLCMTGFDVTPKVHLPRGPVNETITSRFFSLSPPSIFSL